MDVAMNFNAYLRIGAGLVLSTGSVLAGDELWTEYQELIQPILELNCYPCHGNGKHKGSIELDVLQSLEDVQADDYTWELAQEQVGRYAMPPEGEPMPSAAQRRKITDWIDRKLFG